MTAHCLNHKLHKFHETMPRRHPGGLCNLWNLWFQLL
jgi:hypothetical protein